MPASPAVGGTDERSGTAWSHRFPLSSVEAEARPDAIATVSASSTGMVMAAAESAPEGNGWFRPPQDPLKLRKSMPAP